MSRLRFEFARGPAAWPQCVSDDDDGDLHHGNLFVRTLRTVRWTMTKKQGLAGNLARGSRAAAHFQTCVNDSKKNEVNLFTHGDDFVVGPLDEMASWLKDKFEGRFEVMVLLIGDTQMYKHMSTSKRPRFLSRVVR